MHTGNVYCDLLMDDEEETIDKLQLIRSLCTPTLTKEEEEENSLFSLHLETNGK